jgi:hypothetical protein
MNGMAGYDKHAALPFIFGTIDIKAHKVLKDDVRRLISAMIDADMAYMHLCGALDDTGDTGEGSYDEDDAFEHILFTLVKAENADDKKEQAIAALINDFLPAQYVFMEHSGLVITDQT